MRYRNGGYKVSKWDELIPRPESRFLRVKCDDCGNEQIVFMNVSTTVTCNICSNIIAEPTGGRTRVHGEVINVLE